jgi:hypothetical protein
MVEKNEDEWGMAEYGDEDDDWGLDEDPEAYILDEPQLERQASS